MDFRVDREYAYPTERVVSTLIAKVTKRVSRVDAKNVPTTINVRLDQNVWMDDAVF